MESTARKGSSVLRTFLRCKTARVLHGAKSVTIFGRNASGRAHQSVHAAPNIQMNLTTIYCFVAHSECMVSLYYKSRMLM